MAQYSKFIKHNCAPNDSQMVEIYDRKGIKRGVIKIPSSLSTTIKEKPLYSFGALSDVHLCPTEKPEEAAAEQDFQKALTYYENNQDISFICVCGDMTTNGTEKELLVYKNHIDTYTTKPVYSIMGNHDTMSYSGLTGIEDRIQEYTGYPLYYTFEAGNNDLFIMLGSYREARVLSDEELDWFEQILAENQEKRCFVFQHVILGNGKNAQGCGNAYGMYENFCWTDHLDQEERFRNLLTTHPNLLFFHGHTHITFNAQEKDCEYANVDNSNGYWSVHIPSATVPRIDANQNKALEKYYIGSEGYVVDVYDDCIILKGRDFIKNKFLPIATYKLETKGGN